MSGGDNRQVDHGLLLDVTVSLLQPPGMAAGPREGWQTKEVSVGGSWGHHNNQEAMGG